MNVDWGLIKLQYEVFGLSEDEILEDGQVSRTQLRYAIDEQGWQQLPTATTLQDYRDLGSVEDAGADLIDAVQDRLRTLRTIKQAVLSPRYIALETAILGKALETLNTISADQPTAAAQIKVLTEVLTQLKAQNNMVGAGAGGAEGENKGVTVRIMNQVGRNGEVQTGAEVQIAAAKKPEPAI